ncbi:hypothetical protein ACQ4PT_059891 [Festuca glaucescens]
MALTAWCFFSLACLGAFHVAALSFRLLAYLALCLRPPKDLRRRYGAWAVVTGPTSGIGRSISLELARLGLNVVLVGRDAAKLRDMSETISRTHGVKTKTVLFDLSHASTAQGPSEYITAFDQLVVQDPSFNCAPSPSQWTIAEKICKLLVVFYDATVVVSGSLYPTSNAYFKMLWRVKWMLGNEASNENATIKSMVLQMKKKFLKYWKLSYLTMCIPIILDPRCKVEFLNYNLKDDTEVEGPKCLAIVKRKFKEMLSVYSSE